MSATVRCALDRAPKAPPALRELGLASMSIAECVGASKASELRVFRDLFDAARDRPRAPNLLFFFALTLFPMLAAPSLAVASIPILAFTSLAGVLGSFHFPIALSPSFGGMGLDPDPPVSVSVTLSVER